MRGYVITTTAMFGILALVHVARIVGEGTGPLREPVFLLTSLASVAMVAWGLATLRRGGRPSD